MFYRGAHYDDLIMGAMASQITRLTVIYSTVFFGCRSKKTSKFCVTGLCAGNSPGTREFPTQMANIAENVSIWWRHHAMIFCCLKQLLYPMQGVNCRFVPTKLLLLLINLILGALWVSVSNEMLTGALILASVFYYFFPQVDCNL